MIKLKAELLTGITILALLGVSVVVSFYRAYPEAAPAASWVIIAVGFALWAISAALILRIRDER